MGALQIVLTVLAGVVLLGGAALFCRSRALPPPPLRLALLALASWLLLALLPAPLLPPPYRLWLQLSDDLLASFALIRLLLWALLELPGSLRWWPAPPDLLIQLLSLAGWATATVLVVRHSARFDLINLVATSAVLTAVIGLAAQEALKDLFSGLELRLADDFRLGDWLELSDGRRGIVVGFSWRETRLRTVDDCLLLVPNSTITADILTNRSGYGLCSDRFEVGLDYDFPPGRAVQLLREVLLQHPLVLPEPAPVVRVKSFDDSAIGYELQVWQKAIGERARLDLRSELLQQIWYSLQRQGQSIPFPVREVRPRRSTLPPEHRQQPSLELCRHALASVPMFADLSEEQLRLLVSDCQLLTYGSGEAVVREGAEGHSLFCLLRGRVEVVKQVEEGHSLRVRELVAGDVFGEMTLFLDAPRSATVRTLEECQLLRVGRPAVRRLLELNPALLERLAALVGARQAELEQLGRAQQHERSQGLLETMRRLFGVVSGAAAAE